jgi:hypothetical protein
MSSSKNTYRLVNPYIEGSFNKITHAKSTLSGGKKFYSSLSNFFSSPVREHFISIQNVQTKELTHFRINEKKMKNNKVEWTISILNNDQIKGGNSDSDLIQQIDSLEKKNQKGGDNDQSDSESSESNSSSDSELEQNIRPIKYISPIKRYIYFPLPFQQRLCKFNCLYVPTFSLPVPPTVEIRLDLIGYKIKDIETSISKN